MIVGLLTIFGTYGLTIAALHAGRFLLRHKARKPVHVVLVTKNNESQIEWVLRSLWLISWLRATTVNLTVLDEQSEDATVTIVQRMMVRRSEGVTLVVDFEESALDSILALYDKETVVLVRLSQTTELQPIPMF